MLGTDYAICLAFVGLLLQEYYGICLARTYPLQRKVGWCVTDAEKSSSQQQVYMEAKVAKVVCHNLDHETLVLCRELQNPNDSVTFCSCNRLFGIRVLVIHQRKGFIVAVAVTFRMTVKDGCSLLHLKISSHVSFHSF